MAFAHAKNSRVLINEGHQSAQITSVKVTHSREVSEATALTDEGERFVPGLLSGSLAIEGLFNSDAGGLHEEINASIGTDNSLLVTVLPDGFTIGQPAWIAVSDIESYAVASSVKETVSLEIEAAPDDGVDLGVSLHAHSAETADGQGTGVDNTASSANGGVASLHVTAFSGFSGVVFKVQHSTDNSVWADLITFTTATAATSERKTVTGTVNRYVRGFWDVTGTGSVTFVIAFARR